MKDLKEVKENNRRIQSSIAMNNFVLSKIINSTLLDSCSNFTENILDCINKMSNNAYWALEQLELAIKDIMDELKKNSGEEHK